MISIKSSVTGDKVFLDELDDLVKRAQDFKGGVDVGAPYDKPHIGGETLTMGQVAAIHEYGNLARHIPVRAFMKPPLEANLDKYGRYILSQAKDVLLGKTEMRQVWQFIGMTAVGDIQKYMVDGHFTPLSPRTIKKKGSSKPLIDTGQLRQSITYEVKD